MLFVISCIVVGSKSGFRFQIAYLGVLKEKSITLCYVGGSLQNKFSCVMQEIGFICYFEVMDYMYLFIYAVYRIMGFLNYLKHYHLSYLQYISHDIEG